jgi:uridine kinase
MLIIGIAGGTGSGKTTVVHQIMNELPEKEVGIISQDSYYKENHNLSFDERALINFDHPRAIDFDLLVSHLKELKEEKTIHQPVYSFLTHNRTEDTITTHPRKVIIVDEVLTRYQNTLKPMHQQFIEPTKAFADIIIPNDRYNTVAIDVVRAVINQRIL